jgi:thiosulfate/3-mercaptopyruvate sulfurtransferase
MACALAVASMATESTPAASLRDSLLVSTSWLAQHLSDSNLVLLHVGSKADYDVRHIRGARYVPLADISVSDRDHKTNGLTLEMPQADDLRQRLMALGVSNNSRVIVCFAGNAVSQATRVLFTLAYAGLGDGASLLDGGLDAWTRDKHDVTTEVPEARAGALSMLTTNPLVVDAEYVRAHLAAPGVSVVDGRAATFYSGEQTGGSAAAPHKTGHIAGAKSIPFTSITDDTQALKSPDVLARLFADAGVKPGDTIIGYCHIGQQATAVLFAARTLGYSVLLYDGSFEDWSTHTNFPVETTIK